MRPCQLLLLQNGARQALTAVIFLVKKLELLELILYLIKTDFVVIYLLCN